jgi:hypothetical protein
MGEFAALNPPMRNFSRFCSVQHVLDDYKMPFLWVIFAAWRSHAAKITGMKCTRQCFRFD